MSDEIKPTNDLHPEVQLYPPWKEAIKRFMEYEFRPGDVITHEWLFEAFGLPTITPDMPYEEGERIRLLAFKQFDKFRENLLENHQNMPYEEGERIRLLAFKQFDKFRENLLENHQIDLISKPGIGYIFVAPQEQTKIASEDGVHDVRKGLRKMARRLLNVDLTQLSHDQRLENARALEKLAVMKGMLRDSRRKVMLPPPKKDGD